MSATVRITYQTGPVVRLTPQGGATIKLTTPAKPAAVRISPVGLPGARGPEGPGIAAYDPGDITLYFENGLI